MPIANSSQWTGRRATLGCATVLLLMLMVQLAYTSQANSITWDEGHHLFDGYNILKHSDYGLNPEVPPLVKMTAALSVLGMPLQVPQLQNRSFQTEAYLDAKDFMLHNDADRMLFRARMTCAIFMLLLAFGVFTAGYEIFGPRAGLIALAFLVFDPNFLAHGALVTTDVPISCFILWAIYLAYRYVKQPSFLRLALVCIVTGLAMVTKFTGALLPLTFLLLAMIEFVVSRNGRLLLRRLGQILLIGAVSLGFIWLFYGFRYQARPAGLALNPVLSEYLKQIPNPADGRHLATIAHWHILPEAYIFGLANTKITEYLDTSYFFGRVYRHGSWPYFPATFIIKSTLPFLLLLAASLVWIFSKRPRPWREICFLLIFPPVYFAVAMHSQMNIGLRHLLPIYGFLYVLIAGAAAFLIARNIRWSYGIALLLLWQVITSVRVAPAYMAYANEAWGGPASVHKYLSDSNSDWGQQLKATRRYLDSHGIKNCWFANFVDGVVDASYYGVACKRLPTVESLWWLNLPMDVPPEIDGTVLISDSDLAGIEFGGGALNPYDEFRQIKPTAVIDYGLFVFDGHFKVPLASALVKTREAQALMLNDHMEGALARIEEAAALAPQAVSVQETFGDILMKMNRPTDARAHYALALNAAETIQPSLQEGSVPGLKRKLRAAK